MNPIAPSNRTPRTVSAANGDVPAGGKKPVGDTVNLHGPRRDGEFTVDGESRPVDLVVNGSGPRSPEGSSPL
jgi:hypothetical protein